MDLRIHAMQLERTSQLAVTGSQVSSRTRVTNNSRTSLPRPTRTRHAQTGISHYHRVRESATQLKHQAEAP